MSKELKTYDLPVDHGDFTSAVELFYLKSEADKVIRNHKYKRCLAMANYCYTNVHCIMGHRLCALSDRKKEWFERWHKRWLKLAEKFKEGV